MPLPPNATITDVINKLSELEGINQKTELASVIGSPAISTDTVAQQIVKLQNIKDDFAEILTEKSIDTDSGESLENMVSKVSFVGGAPFATGTQTVTSATFSFEYYSNTTSISQPRITVSGLNFRPKFIIVAPVSLIASSDVTEYYRDLSNYNEYVKQSKTITAINSNSTVRAFKAQVASAYVNVTGFSLPVVSSGEYNYYAFG